MRLRTLPLAFSCIGMGGFLAASYGQLNWTIFFLCLVTTLFLQILSNLANDYGDTVHGADNDHRIGPDRRVQSGAISKDRMKSAMILFAVLSLCSGLGLLYMADIPMKVFLGFLVLGLLSIIAAVLYTNGKLPYGYIGLGDLSVFLFFGIVGVMGTFYLQTKLFDWQLLLPASSCGLLTVAVLNINNIRDIESDQIAGKISIPVRLGRSKANVYHSALLLIGLVLALVYVLIDFSSPRQLIFLLVLPLLFINALAIHSKPAEKLDPYLKQMAIINLVFVVLFGLSIV